MKTVNTFLLITCRLLAVCLAGGALFASCRERIDIRTDNMEPRPAISCILTTDTGRCFVHISRTLAYFGHDSSQTFDRARVEINGEALSYVAGSQGTYSTAPSFCGEPGRDYLLEVWFDFDADGTPEYYRAESSMPRMVALDSISLASLGGSHSSPADPPWLVLVHFQDEPGRDYYGAHMYINSVKYSFSYANYYLNQFDASVEDGRYIHFPTYYIDEEFNWYKDVKMYLHSGDTITIELNNMNAAYFDFAKTAKLEVSGSGNPLFAGPPANVPGNISNEAVGIFGVYTTSRKKIVVK